MSDPAYAFQVGTAAAMLGDAGVTALVGTAVYDPLDAAGKPLPMIQIGDDQVIGAENGCTDASEVWSNVHVWADGPGGRLLAKQVADAVRRVMTAGIAVSGQIVTSTILHNARHMTADDPTNETGVAAHSVLTFVSQTYPSPAP